MDVLDENRARPFDKKLRNHTMSTPSVPATAYTQDGPEPVAFARILPDEMAKDHCVPVVETRSLTIRSGEHFEGDSDAFRQVATDMIQRGFRVRGSSTPFFPLDDRKPWCRVVLTGVMPRD